MRRRSFVTGMLLAAAGTALPPWRWRAGAAARGGGVRERLADGRVLARDAALAFGTTVSVSAVHEDGEAAAAAVAAALGAAREIDRLMTVYRPESQVGRLNAEGVLERPDPRLVHVLEVSRRLAAASSGAFDPTVQPLWLLHAEARRRGRPASPAELAEARARVDWTALDVSPRRIALRRSGMAITLNGIAQGYAADLALAALRERGVADALVDTGEHGAEGTRAGRPWTIGLRHPRDPGALVAALPMDGRFVAASGDYETPFSDDLSLHHVLDPRTGRSPPGLSCVVVAAASGVEADALTKPMMILDRAAAQALLDRFPGAGAAWLDKEGRVVGTRGLKLLPG